jgi:hypothetical protein
MTAYQPSIDTKLTQLSVAIKEIKTHNSKVQGDFGDLLAAHLRQSMEEQGIVLDRPEPYNTEANAQEMLHSHRANFSKIGIGLNKQDNSEIVFYFEDMDKLSRFVNQIPKQSTESKPLLQLVAKGLEAQVVSLSDIEDSEYLRNVIGDMDYLYRSLQSRGLSKELERSNRLLSAAESGYLNEQLIVDSSKVLSNGFGPSKWHTDSSTKDLYRRWSEALDVLSSVRRNPKAEALTDKVISAIGQGLESFAKDIKSWESSRFPYQNGNLKDYQGVYRLIKFDFEQKLKDWQCF